MALLFRLFNIDRHADPVHLILAASSANFCTLGALYMIQPIRDEFATAAGLKNLPWLFNASLLIMVFVNRIISRLNASLSPLQIYQRTFLFFIASLAFFAASILTSWLPLHVVGVAFFLWSGVFTILSMSLFWSLVSFHFNSAQSAKFVGLIAAGGTLGQITGSFLTRSLVAGLGSHGMLFLACLLLCGSVVLARLLGGGSHHQLHALPSWKGHSQHSTQGSSGSKEAIGLGSSLLAVLRSPLLLNICLHVMLFSFTASLLYFRKQQIVLESFAESDSRTGFRAGLSGVIGVSTLFLQLFGTGRIISTFGLGLSISLLPASALVGFFALSVAPSLETIAYILFFRKVLAFSLDKPSRECLFTLVNARERLVLKNLIDTVIYRVGDAAAASLFSISQLSAAAPGEQSPSQPLDPLESLTLLPSIESIAVAVSLLWLCISVWLGLEWKRRHAVVKPN